MCMTNLVVLKVTRHPRAPTREHTHEQRAHKEHRTNTNTCEGQKAPSTPDQEHAKATLLEVEALSLCPEAEASDPKLPFLLVVRLNTIHAQGHLT